MDAYNLLDETYTTVAVRFYNEDEEDFVSRTKTYNYKIPKDWAAGLSEGSLLLVKARNTLRVVAVVSVHAEPDFKGYPNLQWVVSVIDQTEYDALVENEERFRNALVSVERQKQKDDLIHQLKTTSAGSPAAQLLLGQALAMIGKTTVEAPPFAPNVILPASIPEAPVL